MAPSCRDGRGEHDQNGDQTHAHLRRHHTNLGKNARVARRTRCPDWDHGSHCTGRSGQCFKGEHQQSAGTHVDAPYRYIQKGLTADSLPLRLLMGAAFVAEVDGLEGNTVQVYDLARLHFPAGTRRLLLKTSNSELWQCGYTDFERDFIHLAPKTAEWLVKRNIELIGMDYLSVEAFGARDFRVHHALLGAGVVILEGLDLSRVPPGPCELENWKNRDPGLFSNDQQPVHIHRSHSICKTGKNVHQLNPDLVRWLYDCGFSPVLPKPDFCLSHTFPSRHGSILYKLRYIQNPFQWPCLKAE